MNAWPGTLAALVAMSTFSSLAGTLCSLVSRGEDAHDWSAPRASETRWLEMIGGPIIELVSPDLSRAVCKPVNVDMRFRAPPGVSVIMTTLRVS